MQRPVRAVALVLAAAAGLAAAAQSAPPQSPAPAFAGVLDEHPFIRYEDSPTRDRILALDRALQQGTRQLSFDPRGGYLPSVLEALGIAVESQVLVFSKTGIQRAVTGPRNPRALFFDESVVVGYIPGAPLLELTAHDPEMGVVFYTLRQEAGTPPAFTRRTTECLTCHVSGNTLDVPGLIHRSNVVGADGGVMPMLGSHTVDHRTPITERWGGWLVTGIYARPPYDGTGHLGNVTVSVHPKSGPVTTSNEVFINWLNADVQPRGYPSHESDIAALMVFDHQSHAVNLMTRLHWEARVAAKSGELDTSRGAVGDLVAQLADYLLFVGEAPTPGRVIPRRGFPERFAAGAPRDRRARSLRDLDLDGRLLRYPCSYMVYTEAFASLPAAVKAAVYERMWTILSGRETGTKYAHLSESDRAAIVEILRDTKTDLPRVFGLARQ